MNWDQIAGQWKQFKGKVKEQWGNLTDDDLDVTDRPVKLYTMEGQLVGTYKNPVGDGPIRIAVSPGHYLVVSESHWTQRKVQANVEDRQETVVPEALLSLADL